MPNIVLPATKDKKGFEGKEGFSLRAKEQEELVILSSMKQPKWQTDRQNNTRQCKLIFKGYLQIIKCNVFYNFKTPYSRKDCLSNHEESWFGQPVSRIHNWDAFILSWNKIEYSQQTHWLTNKFKQVSWLEISASNFNYNMWSIYEITDGKCLPDSQPLFEIKFQQWNQLVESTPACII